MWVVGFVRPFGAGGCGMGFPGLRTLGVLHPGLGTLTPSGSGRLRVGGRRSEARPQRVRSLTGAAR